MASEQPKRKPRPGVDEYGRIPLHYAALDGVPASHRRRHSLHQWDARPLAELRLARRVSLATRGRPNERKAAEVWLATRQLRKWKKLRDIAASDPDANSRAMASRVLRLELLFYSLFVPGKNAVLVGVAVETFAGS